MEKTVNQNRVIISIVLNITIVTMEAIGLVWNYFRERFDSLQYFTEDSNILAFVASCVFLATCFWAYKNKSKEYPNWVRILRYIATTCLSLTFSVVLLIFPFMTNGLPSLKIMMLQGPMLFHHFLCPVVSFVSFVFFEEGLKFSRKTVFIAIIPILAYAIITVILNVAHILDGPYPFLKVYEQSILVSIIWFIVICGGSGLFAALILWINSRRSN